MNRTAIAKGQPVFTRLIFVVFVVLNLSCVSVHGPDASLVKQAAWHEKKVAIGIVWKYHHFSDLFDSRQSITVLDIDPDAATVAIEHVDSGFFKTSAKGIEVGAIAAINGSFFNTKTGGAAVFFRKHGRILYAGDNNPRAYRDNAGFAIDVSGNVSIVKKPQEGWMDSQNPLTVLSSGPLLVSDGAMVPQVPEKFNTNRHPRTAVGITKRGHLIAVVADGRSAEAYGMTTGELATLMRALGCVEAMNLDGGGSSTAWVKGEPFNGVVNFPSDNKKFDHLGERAVSNCIVFFPKE